MSKKVIEGKISLTWDQLRDAVQAALRVDLNVKTLEVDDAGEVYSSAKEWRMGHVVIMYDGRYTYTSI